MRVCLVNALFHPFSGGVEKHIYELSRELVRQGIDVTVITSLIVGTDCYEELDGVKIHRIPCLEIRIPRIYPPPWIISPMFVHHLKKIDDKHSFDIIHLHSRYFWDFNMAAVYARLKGKPFVMTVHNSRPEHIPLPVAWIGTAYDWLIGRIPFMLADRIISVSEWSKQDIAKYHIDRNKIVTIHNGINLNEFRPAPGVDIRKRYGLGNDPLILFVGRLVVQKGLPYLIDAMPLVLKEHPDAKLLIVGRGGMFNKLKDKVLRMGLEESVIFSGYLPEEMLKEAYGACDVFVLPSLVEPFGIVVAEAMACGKPVICTDSGGVGEIVRDGVNGYIVPVRDSRILAEKINLILSDDGLKGALGRKGREIVERRFDWRLIAASIAGVYEELLAEKQTRGNGQR